MVAGVVAARPDGARLFALVWELKAIFATEVEGAPGWRARMALEGLLARSPCPFWGLRSAAPEPVLFDAMKAAARAYVREADDAARERLAGLGLAACEALLRACADADRRAQGRPTRLEERPRAWGREAAAMGGDG